MSEDQKPQRRKATRTEITRTITDLNRFAPQTMADVSLDAKLGREAEERSFEILDREMDSAIKEGTARTASELSRKLDSYRGHPSSNGRITITAGSDWADQGAPVFVIWDGPNKVASIQTIYNILGQSYETILVLVSDKGEAVTSRHDHSGSALNLLAEHLSYFIEDPR